MYQINLKRDKIVEILEDLGKRLPNRRYEMYIPSPDFNSEDIISVQKEANRMLKHIGLNNYLATITYENTIKGTAGYINLNYEKDVWITIDKYGNHRKKSVLAVMAHEICHKFLFVNGIHFAQPFGDILEWYTDLATIYVGFATLTLNGCKIHSSYKFHDQVTTVTYLTGYLEKSNYEYAYLTILSKKHLNFWKYNKYLDEKITLKKEIKFLLGKL